MSTPFTPRPEARSANPFWLRAVRILCVCTLLAILVPWAVVLLRQSSGRWSDLAVLLLYSPLWAPFAWVSWRLSTNPDSFIVRRALILAASWALLALALTTVFTLAGVEDGGSGPPSASIPGAIATLQFL